MSIDINARLLQQADARTQGGSESAGAAPAAGAQDRFEQALQRKEGEGRGSGQQDGESDAQDGAERGASTARDGGRLPSATELMGNLFAGRLQTAAPEGAQAAAPAAQAADELVSTLVDRILVSEPGKGNPEVRLTLGDGPLKGTELSLMRAQDGQLQVRLTCADAGAFQTAVGAQHELRTALERSNSAVRVTVTQQDGADAHGGDSQRQSRGLDYMPSGEDA